MCVYRECWQSRYHIRIFIINLFFARLAGLGDFSLKGVSYISVALEDNITGI